MENNRIEYKRELTDGLKKEGIAFLNYHDGGHIYIGIDSAGDVYGVPDCDAVQLAIKDRLKNNIQPSCLGLFDVIHETRNGKNIIKLRVTAKVTARERRESLLAYKPNSRLQQYRLTDKGKVLLTATDNDHE